MTRHALATFLMVALATTVFVVIVIHLHDQPPSLVSP